MADQTMTVAASRAVYIPDKNVIASMRKAVIEERIIQLSLQPSLQTAQKPAVSSSLAVRQLQAPRAGIAQDSGQVKSLAEAVRSVGLGDADVSETVKRIGANVARWEDALSKKTQAHAQALSDFSASVEHAQTAVDNCVRGGTTIAGFNAAAAAVAEAVRKEAVCNAAAKQLPAGPDLPGVDVTRSLSATAVLTIVLAKLQKLMSDSNIDALDGQRKMLDELSSARQASLQKAADEYAAKMAEAKRLQDTFGLLAQIGGWALTIIGVGMAMFTGGASLVVASAGLALMAADAICKAATGTSFMEEAMKPLMDNVIKPMMEWLNKQVTAALEACGVPKEQAEIAGAVVAGIAVAAVMVAAVVAVGSAAGKVASAVAESTSKQLAQIMESAVVRSVKDVMAKLADNTGMTSLASRTKTLFNGMRSQVGLKELEEGQIRALATRGKAGLTIGETALTGTRAAVDMIAAADVRDASVMQAAVTRALADKKVIAKMLQELVTTLSSSLSAMTSLGNAMSETLKNEMAADAFVLNNARAV